jgi:hypothetical protein
LRGVAVPGKFASGLQPIGDTACQIVRRAILRQEGDVMRVKTYTGSETAKVDKRVNDWLAQFGIKPHHTNTAIGQFTVKAEDQRTGKPVNRRVAVIAISVWYEEPSKQGE